MKRRKITNQETPLRYKKLTGGLHFTADGRKIKKGQIFECLPSKMPKMFLKSFECLDKVKQAPEDSGMKLEVKPAGKNRWNLVNNLTGLPINNTPLTAQQAKTFLDEGEKLPVEKVIPVKAKKDPEPEKVEETEDLEEDEDAEEEYDD